MEAHGWGQLPTELGAHPAGRPSTPTPAEPRPWERANCSGNPGWVCLGPEARGPGRHLGRAHGTVGWSFYSVSFREKVTLGDGKEVAWCFSREEGSH